MYDPSVYCLLTIPSGALGVIYGRTFIALYPQQSENVAVGFVPVHVPLLVFPVIIEAPHASHVWVLFPTLYSSMVFSTKESKFCGVIITLCRHLLVFFLWPLFLVFCRTLVVVCSHGWLLLSLCCVGSADIGCEVLTGSVSVWLFFLLFVFASLPNFWLFTFLWCALSVCCPFLMLSQNFSWDFTFSLLHLATSSGVHISFLLVTYIHCEWASYSKSIFLNATCSWYIASPTSKGYFFTTVLCCVSSMLSCVCKSSMSLAVVHDVEVPIALFSGVISIFRVASGRWK